MESFDEWQLPSQIEISRNGKYLYFITEQSITKRKTLSVRDRGGSLYGDFLCLNKPWFSADSRNLVWLISQDSLCVFNLTNFSPSYIPNVREFWLHGNLLLYRLDDEKHSFWIVDLKTNRKRCFFNVVQFKFSRIGETLVIKCHEEDNISVLFLIDLNSWKMSNIFRGGDIEVFVVDDVGKQVAFMIKGELYLYKRYKYCGLVIIGDMPSKHFIGRLHSFSKDGKNLFVDLEKDNDRFLLKNKKLLNIWNYEMVKLPTETDEEQMISSKLASISLSDRRLHLLGKPGELIYFPGYEKVIDSVCLVSHRENGIFDERNNEMNLWELLYTYTGERKELAFANNASFITVSLGGKYVIYYDKVQKDYFSYDISIGKLINITRDVKVSWERNVDSGAYGYKSICAWLKNDVAFLVYSQDDIWQIDPRGIHPPIRLTNGYGSIHHLKFFLALESYSYRYLEIGETLILSAFDLESKDNGFYKLIVGKVKDPELLTMGPYLYCVSENPEIPSYLNFSPIKAEEADIYILRRMSSTEAPNYFITSDFKSFQQVTQMVPHKSFNWYFTELHSWKSLKGRNLQGILYKPENFDSLKKYPVIFYFYERMSARLNAYLRPDALSGGNSINIPYYVSNGYLVFCPDIYYEKGDPMEGTYDAIVSAVNYLTSLPYVNNGKIGVQGSSWGAIQTNYLITHTSLFAAACSASGLSDWISGYGSLMGDGTSAHEIYEKGQLRVGASLWEKPEIYIKNSTVLNANKVTTPLLMMHTNRDGLCSFTNAFELFLALRRLGKKVWLLEYEGNHTLNGENARDFSVRMKQFFDHYLMEKCPPRWMTQSIPWEEQSNSYELEKDDDIETSGRGLNIK
ncbi:alpha/beta hydrolase family protein [Chitinophaga sp.]|uniref:alpha/beta hydrolase family protein n=1 Tax=Chitinophaga sp. TaxID=1869181 RepID=UPI002F91EF28